MSTSAEEDTSLYLVRLSKAKDSERSWLLNPSVYSPHSEMQFICGDGQMISAVCKKAPIHLTRKSQLILREGNPVPPVS